MLQRLRKIWSEFDADRPGERFQQRYYRRSSRAALRKLLCIAGGILIMAAGIFFLPAPGPGFLILFIGAGLLAEQSLIAARALDRIEVRLRRLAAWGERAWRAASLSARVALVCAAIFAGLGAGYAGYQWMLTG